MQAGRLKIVSFGALQRCVCDTVLSMVHVVVVQSGSECVMVTGHKMATRSQLVDLRATLPAGEAERVQTIVVQQSYAGAGPNFADQFFLR